ncbi:kinase [Tsuneonella mangrovi]|uniref:kinase n=1 Tax=Tsuneonella mangrovi TaxID=1982042 RepID=UPI000BA1D7FB|nr:kinase [Tsuneonella mangrovi]
MKSVSPKWHEVDRAVAIAIAECHASLGRTVVIGLAGAQGSGKTTMAARLASLLGKEGLRAAVLALDDFYLTRAERLALAREVHPLLATRGVPGTHDVALLQQTLDALTAGEGQVKMPRFDKARDDRADPVALLPPFNVVLLEGWCIGAQPQAPTDLAQPVNALEHNEDPDGTWRRWVNDRLAGDYAALFARVDLQLFLRAPGFEIVERWRAEQEGDLASPAMDRQQLSRFVAHYERITRSMIADEPADIVIDLDEMRTPMRSRHRDR